MTNLRNLNFPFHSKSKVQIHIQAERKREGKKNQSRDLAGFNTKFSKLLNNYKKCMVNNENN